MGMNAVGTAAKIAGYPINSMVDRTAAAGERGGSDIPGWRKALGGVEDSVANMFDVGALPAVIKGGVKGLWPAIRAAAGYSAGSAVVEKGADALGAPPEVSRGAGMLAGIAGGTAAQSPKVTSLPVLRSATTAVSNIQPKSMLKAGPIGVALGSLGFYGAEKLGLPYPLRWGAGSLAAGAGEAIPSALSGAYEAGKSLPVMNPKLQGLVPPDVPVEGSVGGTGTAGHIPSLPVQRTPALPQAPTQKLLSAGTPTFHAGTEGIVTPEEYNQYQTPVTPNASPAVVAAPAAPVAAPVAPAVPAAPTADPMEIFRKVEATKAPVTKPVAAPVAAAPEVKPTVQVEKPAPKPEVQAVKSAPKPAPVKSEPAKPEPVKSESKYRTVEPPVKIKSEPARLAQLQAKDNPSSAEMDEMERLIKKGVSPPKSAETALGNKEIDPKTLETSPRAGAEKQALEAHKMPADEYEKSETDRRKLTTELLDKHKKTPLTPEETTQLRNAFTDAPADKIGLGEIASLARSHSVTTSQMARKLIDIGVPIEESKVGGYGLGTKMSTKSLEAHGKLDESVILKQLEALGKRPEKFTETRGSIAKAQTDAVVGQVRKKMGLAEK
jgi:hypothetical protein